MSDATEIHPTAVVHPRATLGAGCQVGPYCVISEHAFLGDHCRVHSHVIIDGHTVLGSRNEIFPFACIGLKTQDLKWNGGISHTLIGNNNTFREHVTVHSATGDGETTTIGSENHFLAYSHVAHNVNIGNRVIMSNVATLAGHVVVEDYAVIGGLAAIHQFCRIGRMSIIGGCSKVVQDIAPYMLADGNPAKTRAINKVGLERNGVSEAVQNALKKAHRILFRDGLTIPNAVARIESELPASPELDHFLNFVRNSDRGLTK